MSWTDNSTKEAGFTIQRASDANFTTGLTTFTVPAAAGPEQCDLYGHNRREEYELLVQGVRNRRSGRRHSSLSEFTRLPHHVCRLCFQPHFRSMWDPNSGGAGKSDPPDGNRAAGPQVSLTWRDNATNETGFVVERCTGARHHLHATSPDRHARTEKQHGQRDLRGYHGSGRQHLPYQVKAVNAVGRSVASYEPTNAAMPAIPAAPTNFTVSAVKTRQQLTATLKWQAATNPTNFTIQRATNATFTSGLTTFTVSGAARSSHPDREAQHNLLLQDPGEQHAGGSSAWTNALPFPIRTGP